MSVATGSVQFTWAENRARSAYTINGIAGHVAPNFGGRISAIRKSIILAAPSIMIFTSYYFPITDLSYGYLYN